MVDIVVLSLGLQTTFAPTILSLTSPLGTPTLNAMVGCENLGLYFKSLAGPLRRQLYQSPFSKQFLASIIRSGFGNLIAILVESQRGSVSL